MQRVASRALSGVRLLAGIGIGFTFSDDLGQAVDFREHLSARRPLDLAPMFANKFGDLIVAMQ